MRQEEFHFKANDKIRLTSSIAKSFGVPSVSRERFYVIRECLIRMEDKNAAKAIGEILMGFVVYGFTIPEDENALESFVEYLDIEEARFSSPVYTEEEIDRSESINSVPEDIRLAIKRSRLNHSDKQCSKELVVTKRHVASLLTQPQIGSVVDWLSALRATCANTYLTELIGYANSYWLSISKTSSA